MAYMFRGNSYYGISGIIGFNDIDQAIRYLDLAIRDWETALRLDPDIPVLHILRRGLNVARRQRDYLQSQR